MTSVWITGGASGIGRATALRPEDVAGAIAWTLSLPSHVCVNELQISPTSSYHYAGVRPAG